MHPRASSYARLYPSSLPDSFIPTPQLVDVTMYALGSQSGSTDLA